MAQVVAAFDEQIDALQARMASAVLDTALGLAYQVVRSVTCMVFFSNPSNWPQTGYPGPVEL